MHVAVAPILVTNHHSGPFWMIAMIKPLSNRIANRILCIINNTLYWILELRKCIAKKKQNNINEEEKGKQKIIKKKAYVAFAFSSSNLFIYCY